MICAVSDLSPLTVCINFSFFRYITTNPYAKKYYGMIYPRFSILSFGIVLNDVGTVCKQNTQVHCDS